MKKNLSTLVLLMVCLSSFAQQNSPTLTLAGNSPHLVKGSINTELLTSIIQQKQEEVKQKAFRNTIVSYFQKSNDTRDLNNFTTYHYIYNIMDVLTSGKNKTSITKSLMEGTSEFTYVFGFAMYVRHYSNICPEDSVNKIFKSKRNGFDSYQASYENNTVSKTEAVKEFNLLLDLCYDVILTDTASNKPFHFKKNLSDRDFEVWFHSDNTYYQDSLNAEGGKRTDLINSRNLVTKRLAEFSDFFTKNIIPFSDKMLSNLKSIKTINDAKLRTEIDSLLASARKLSGNDVKLKMEKIKNDYNTILNSTQKEKLDSAIAFVDDYYNNFKEIALFYNGLKKSDYKNFTLTSDQYYAMKFLLVKFLGIAKNQYPNDIIASVIDFLLENTIIEYTNDAGNPKLETEVKDSTDKGYLYIDVESVIAAVNQKFSSSTQKGLGVYIQPFFSIGVNYASFTKTNALTTDSIGNPSSLQNIYYASEKIGIKWKLWNWKYTRSFAAGQNFKYFNQSNILNPWSWHGRNWKNTKKRKWARKWNPDRYWISPQQKPLFNDVHVIVYGSGLLYNIANLKSNANFNYAIAGTGIGFTFFNGLSVNAGIACPFTGNQFQSRNKFFNFGFDIPIIDYISALGKNN